MKRLLLLLVFAGSLVAITPSTPALGQASRCIANRTMTEQEAKALIETRLEKDGWTKIKFLKTYTPEETDDYWLCTTVQWDFLIEGVDPKTSKMRKIRRIVTTSNKMGQ